MRRAMLGSVRAGCASWSYRASPVHCRVAPIHVFNSLTGRFDLDTDNASQVSEVIGALGGAEAADAKLAINAMPVFVAAQMHDHSLMSKAAAIADRLVAATKVEEEPLQLPTMTAESIVTLYANSGRLADAHELFTTLGESGAEISEFVYDTLIQEHSKAGDLSTAMKVLDALKAGGRLPNEHTYTTVALAADKAGDAEGARACAKEMLNNGLKFHVSADQEAAFDAFKQKHQEFLVQEAQTATQS